MLFPFLLTLPAIMRPLFHRGPERELAPAPPACSRNRLDRPEPCPALLTVGWPVLYGGWKCELAPASLAGPCDKAGSVLLLTLQAVVRNVFPFRIVGDRPAA